MRIALLIMCTNKYDQFLRPLLESASKYFLTGHDVSFVVFTDKRAQLQKRALEEKWPWCGQVWFEVIEHLPWPCSTLFRYERIWRARENLASFDHLFYCDVDMEFVAPVGDEILSEGITLTQHPGYYGQVAGFPHETNTRSLAWVPPDRRKMYFAGGFNGGTRAEFLDLSLHCATGIAADLKKHTVAIWHDESWLNHFASLHPDRIKKKLTPEYCWSYNHPHAGLTERLVALDKNHAEVRE